MKPKAPLNAAHLRLIALATMLIDHVGAVLFPRARWMRYVGRLAFPIFAFQIAEGYRHTHDFRRYCLRLLILGLVSEIPFDLMIGGRVLDWGHQNVMFTLLLGLLAIRCYDRQQHLPMALALFAGELLATDYGMLGVLTVLAFHIFRNAPWVRLGGMALIHGVGFGGAQTFAVAAMLPISLYNGQKGPGGKTLQLAAYLFYPLHMLILAML